MTTDGRRSAMRGDFWFIPSQHDTGYVVRRRVKTADAEAWPVIGTVVKITARRWDGFSLNGKTCAKYASREQAAYCLDRMHLADYHGGW